MRPTMLCLKRKKVMNLERRKSFMDKRNIISTRRRKKILMLPKLAII